MPFVKGHTPANSKKKVDEPAEASKNAIQEPNVTEAIVTPAPKETLPDRSPLDPESRMLSLINLMKQLPKQYWDDPHDGKKNLWAILRFEPTDEQISAAREAIANEPERNPR